MKKIKVQWNEEQKFFNIFFKNGSLESYIDNISNHGWNMYLDGHNQQNAIVIAPRDSEIYLSDLFNVKI